jgi:hypothetical protein
MQRKVLNVCRVFWVFFFFEIMFTYWVDTNVFEGSKEGSAERDGCGEGGWQGEEGCCIRKPGSQCCACCCGESCASLSSVVTCDIYGEMESDYSLGSRKCSLTARVKFMCSAPLLACTVALCLFKSRQNVDGFMVFVKMRTKGVHLKTPSLSFSNGLILR